MIIKDEIEKKARELFLQGGFGHEDTYNTAPQHYRDGWICIAKHVLTSEIKARLEEMPVINKRYHEFKAKLEELEANNG